MHSSANHRHISKLWKLTCNPLNLQEIQIYRQCRVHGCYGIYKNQMKVTVCRLWRHCKRKFIADKTLLSEESAISFVFIWLCTDSLPAVVDRVIVVYRVSLSWCESVHSLLTQWIQNTCLMSSNICITSIDSNHGNKSYYFHQPLHITFQWTFLGNCISPQSLWADMNLTFWYMMVAHNSDWQWEHCLIVRVNLHTQHSQAILEVSPGRQCITKYWLQEILFSWLSIGWKVEVQMFKCNTKYIYEHYASKI